MFQFHILYSILIPYSSRIFHAFRVLIYVIQNQNFVNFDKTLYFIIIYLAGISIRKMDETIRCDFIN